MSTPVGYGKHDHELLMRLRHMTIGTLVNYSVNTHVSTDSEELILVLCERIVSLQGELRVAHEYNEAGFNSENP